MASPTDIVTIDDVAAHLNWSDSQKAKQAAEMGGFIEGVTAIVESITGPIVPRSVTEWHNGGSSVVVLDQCPVVSVTSVTETWGAGLVYTLTEEPLDGSSMDAYGYTIDKARGILVRRWSGMTGQFARGTLNVVVTYEAGYADVPPNVRIGTLELIRINWQPQQGGNRPGYTSMSGVDEDQTDGAWRMGYFVPNRVMQQLMPSRNLPGIA